MSELKELTESLEQNIEKIGVSMDRALALAKACGEMMEKVIARLREVLGDSVDH